MSQIIENPVVDQSTASSQDAEQLDAALAEVTKVIAPVWPLKDYVAVNPYAGIADKPFLSARSYLQAFSKCETLMPLSYFAQQYQMQRFSLSDIMQAAQELGVRDWNEASAWTEESIATKLAASLPTSGDSEAAEGSGSDPLVKVRPMTWYADQNLSVKWSHVISDEVSKLCAAHYDDGQAVWGSPWQGSSLYEAWKNQAAVDRNVEALGLTGFREFVSQLPSQPRDAIASLLVMLDVPAAVFGKYLSSLAFSMPGWSAWAKYQSAWSDAEDNDDLIGLLAIRLAYDVALAKRIDVSVDWSASEYTGTEEDAALSSDVLLRAVLLRASEIGFRDQTIGSMNLKAIDDQSAPAATRKLAQMVFCIDVRSERIRRKLEAVSDRIETFGFAGFFGMPVEFVPMGQTKGKSHVPALLKPAIQLREGFDEPYADEEQTAIESRNQIRSWRKLWKGFQTSAVGCFSFVETLGFLYGWKLLRRAIGVSAVPATVEFDGLNKDDRDKFGPTLHGLTAQGLSDNDQADIAHGMLTNLGLLKDFARLVALCGHASQTDNNPLAAGLDCGACCGHSGEPNARMAAMLLNHGPIRKILAERGIVIPEDTHFLGGLHNTTTDELTFFDLEELPASHADDLALLNKYSAEASGKTRTERLPIVQSDSMEHLLGRAGDWSEVRPEWGLAGNAAFIIAPRSMTIDANLDGRSFMHSYDYRNDPDGAVLETIMTAPMVVTHWINMQYYASTVDNGNFGSGNKTVHNVVGRFGVLSGNGGDLMTGLPWQSLHTGDDYQHLPMRLQAVIASPRSAIETVLTNHPGVADLINNQWMHLIAIEDGQAYQYANQGEWLPIG